MKRHDIIFWLFSLCAVIVSCAKDDSVPENTDKRYEFILNVGHQNGMRMASQVMQIDENPFRGIQSLCVIPFHTEDANPVIAGNSPLISIATGTEANRVSDKDYYYIGFCSLRETTNRVLVYGRSAQYSSNPAVNGQLNTEVGTIIVPNDISFSLQSIRNNVEVHTDAKALADYLTAIANTEGWSTTTNSGLKDLYLKFIHVDPDGTGLIAGSAANVKAYVDALEVQLGEDALSTAIKASINSEAKSCLTNGYPGSLGLPDGAAVLRWTTDENENEGFFVRTQTTTLDNINGINRYTHPAELWYYVNSPIRTSEEKIGKTAYENATTWNALLDNYDGNNNTSITVNTQSVAVKDPLQYGVGRLQIILNAITANPLNDANGDEVNYTDENGFKLTGVIIGGQRTVGFDFKPQGGQVYDDTRFIYDTQVGDHENNAAITVNTLVLQSYDGEKVPVVLELENKTGQKFAGKDGMIYSGTKFYLIAQLDPANATNKDDDNVAAAKGRVFTQDCTTKVTMTITSLANAYSCLPDLLQPRLEIGVQVQMNWIQSTPTTVKL